MINICNAFQTVVVMLIVLVTATVTLSLALNVSDSSWKILDELILYIKPVRVTPIVLKVVLAVQILSAALVM